MNSETPTAKIQRPATAPALSAPLESARPASTDATAPLPPPLLKMGARVAVNPEGYPDFVYEGVLASDDEGGATLDIKHLGKISRARVRPR